VAAPEARTLVRALRVFGVIVAPVADELIMLKKAAVFGPGEGRIWFH
jgi:hypothetical protein